MEPQKIAMFRDGENESSKPAASKKLPYVSTWANFSKLPDDEKSKIFNAMRSELMGLKRMEDGK